MLIYWDEDCCIYLSFVTVFCCFGHLYKQTNSLTLIIFIPQAFEPNASSSDGIQTLIEIYGTLCIHGRQPNHMKTENIIYVDQIIQDIHKVSDLFPWLHLAVEFWSIAVPLMVHTVWWQAPCQVISETYWSVFLLLYPVFSRVKGINQFYPDFSIECISSNISFSYSILLCIISAPLMVDPVWQAPSEVNS